MHLLIVSRFSMQVEKRSCVSSKKRGIHGLSKIDNKRSKAYQKGQKHGLSKIDNKRSKAYQKGQKHQINKNSTVSKQNRKSKIEE